MTGIRCLAAAPLLLGPRPDVLEALDAYVDAGGYRSTPAGLVDAIDAAGLRGRGGAAFPLATKLRAVIAMAKSSRRRPVVVANGAEGEPGSVKDRHLMRARPHLVLDGLRHVAAAVGADRAFAYVSDAASADRLRDALAERPLSVPVAVVEVAPAYVAGEETAVVRYLNGGPSLPVAKPPRPFERGIGGAPTSVSNVETLAHVALLAAGTDATDHLLLTIAGKDVAPTLVEVVRGVPLRRVLAACGWWHATGALMGGAFGGFVDDKGLAVPLDPDSLAAAGTALGCAAIHLITPFDCPVDVAAGALAFLARESSRQCGVCVSGTRALADTVGRLRDGHATGEDITNLHRWAGGLPGRGACGLLDAAARVTGSLLAVHSAAVATHCAAAASGRPCPACAATPVPDAVRLTVAPPAAASPTLAGRPA